jgi:hypothetical protein
MTQSTWARNGWAKDGRKVLVVISDGDDTVKNTTYAQALEQALRNEVMIYTLIDVPIEASAGRDTGRRTRADHAGRADRRQVFLRRRRRAGQGVCTGKRRPAHAVSAGLLSAQSGAGRIFHRIARALFRGAAAQDFNVRHRKPATIPMPGPADPHSRATQWCNLTA